MFLWVISMPFGSPVEPEVYKITKSSSGSASPQGASSADGKNGMSSKYSFFRSFPKEIPSSKYSHAFSTITRGDLAFSIMVLIRDAGYAGSNG